MWSDAIPAAIVEALSLCLDRYGECQTPEICESFGFRIWVLLEVPPKIKIRRNNSACAEHIASQDTLWGYGSVRPVEE